MVRASSRRHSSRRGARTRSRRSRCAPTSRTSSPTTARPSLRTASSAASRSSRAIRSAVPKRARSSCGVSSTSRTSAAGASRCSACRRSASVSTARSACARCITATRRWSTPRRSRLEGRAIRKVRQSVHRLQRAGYRDPRASPVRARRRSCRRSSRRSPATWRGSAPERGWVMAMDAFFRPGDDDIVFVVGFDPDGRAAGLPPLRRVESRLGALALVDAAASGRAERLHGVADLRVDRLGARRAGSPASR